MASRPNLTAITAEIIDVLGKVGYYHDSERVGTVPTWPAHLRRTRAGTGREIYFALYQTLADSGETLGVFRDYPPDYFDLIVVDECHRGSARGESDWHAILEHFSPAVQIGMTATPKRDANIDTYNYFAEPEPAYDGQSGDADPDGLEDAGARKFLRR